jgi:phosphoesterase RecJ-like protein
MWTEVLTILQEHRRFVITTHTSPDLDALGSELALEEHLRERGKEVSVLNSDPIPRPHRFVDPQRRIRTYRPSRHDPVIQRAEVIVVLDASGGWSRVGRIGQVLSRLPAISLRIDHHPDSPKFTDMEVVIDEAAATAELIYDLVRCGGGAISPTMARALYVAILTDTGSFRFPKTSPVTHRIAADLIECGADPADLYSIVYNRYAPNRLRLQGHILNSLQLGAAGRLAWSALAQSTMLEYGVQVADLDNFAGLGLQIDGVRVSLLCVEMLKNQLKVSLRSDGSVAVNDLAINWGGGGHASAAGAIIKGEFTQLVPEVVARVEDLLRQQPAADGGQR